MRLRCGVLSGSSNCALLSTHSPIYSLFTSLGAALGVHSEQGPALFCQGAWEPSLCPSVCSGHRHAALLHGTRAHACVHTHTHTHVCTETHHAGTHAYTGTRVCIHTRAHLHTPTHRHEDTHTDAHTSTHTRAHPPCRLSRVRTWGSPWPLCSGKLILRAPHRRLPSSSCATEGSSGGSGPAVAMVLSLPLSTDAAIRT